MKIIMFYFSLIFFALFISGCDNSEEKFNEAKKIGTVEAYQQFIEEFPNSKYTDTAKIILDLHLIEQKTDITQRRIKWGIEFLEYRDDLIYVKKESEPYTGITFDLYENGNLRSEFNYVKGKLNGPSTIYYESGKKESMAMHVNGIVEGLEMEWWENGNKRKEWSHKNGQVQGKVTQWKENGELFQTYTVKPIEDSTNQKN